ncbi:unnamed protein product [Onchocerca ochengi]|uniref:SET domain-containing protein n=1 Tax=Onchocerca ochengi TaxID=42157 RepID=A0A182E1V0_ONCOC|nr:unnamed protein product [Onchocerca ochengi]
MHLPLAVNDNDQQSVNDNDGRGVHLIYSEYDSPPSETDVEIIEEAKHYWWQSSKSSGKEVCLVYSDYDEPSSETSVDMNKLFDDNRIDGREVRLIYSDYDEPPSETDVEYDGRPWCSIFGNPALWKIRDEGRELHLIYSEYTEPKSEASVEFDSGTQSEVVKSKQEISWSADDISSNNKHSTISSDIYTRLVPLEKVAMPIQYFDNMEQLLALADDDINKNSILEYLEGQELNTADTNSIPLFSQDRAWTENPRMIIVAAEGDLSMVSSISTHCDTALENTFEMDENASSNSG